MGAVAVGGLHDHIVRRGYPLRVAQYGLARVADVAGKDELFRLAALAQPYLDAGRAEQVPDVRKADRDALRGLYGLTVRARAQELHERFNVPEII